MGKGERDIDEDDEGSGLSGRLEIRESREEGIYQETDEGWSVETKQNRFSSNTVREY